MEYYTLCAGKTCHAHITPCSIGWGYVWEAEDYDGAPDAGDPRCGGSPYHSIAQCIEEIRESIEIYPEAWL